MDERLIIMRLPWFMHCHAGQNTLVGMLPTPCGTYVRSWKDGFLDVSWYPIGHEFPGGESRGTKNLGKFFDEDGLGLQNADQAVIDHMHAHPVLCMTNTWDPKGETITWSRMATGVSTYWNLKGTWLRVTAGGFVTISLLPVGNGAQIEIARLSDACSEESLEKRISERMMRYQSTLDHTYEHLVMTIQSR